MKTGLIESFDQYTALQEIETPHREVACLRDCEFDREQRKDNALRMCAVWNACHGLELPDTAPPSILADLVAQCRSLVNAYAARGYGLGPEMTEFEDILAKLSPEPAPPVSPPRGEKDVVFQRWLSSRFADPAED